MKQVFGWNSGTQSSNTTTSALAFNRFCSADLPSTTAFFNAGSGLGSTERIFMHGEESGGNGWLQGTVATGTDAGKSYTLGKFNLTTNGSGLTGVGGWENALANPFTQDKTVVIGNNDGGTGIMTNALAVYVGMKQSTGSEVEKAGLMNGVTKFVNIAGMTTEGSTGRGAAVLPNSVPSGTAFSLSGTASTSFLRPEDGAWDTTNPSRFYFVTTDRYDQTKDGVGATTGRSRLWALNFSDITNPDAGGTIDMLLDGTEAGQMFDNLTVDTDGQVMLLEDVGSQAHNGKVWSYNPANDSLTLIAKHDPARNGDIGVAVTGPFNNDEEFSGIIDITSIMQGSSLYNATTASRWYAMVDQQHYTTGATTSQVEGGQLLIFSTPEPSRALFGMIGLGAIFIRRRRA